MEIREISFFRLLLVFYACNFCMHAAAGDKVKNTITGAKELGKSIEHVADVVVPAAERLTELLAKHGIIGLTVASKTAVDIANIAAPVVENVAQIAGDSLVDASAKIAVESVEKLAAVGDKAVVVIGVVAGAAVAAHSFAQLYPIGKEIAAYACPSEERIALEKANTERAQKEREKLKAEREFRECLLNNKKYPDRSASGLPMVCLSAAEAFSQFGEEVEVKRATECFNSFREEECSRR